MWCDTTVCHLSVENVPLQRQATCKSSYSSLMQITFFGNTGNFLSSHFYKLVKEQCILCIYSGNVALEAEHILICKLQTGGWSLPSLLPCWITPHQWLSLVVPWPCKVGRARPPAQPAALQQELSRGRALQLTGALPNILREFQQGSEATAYKSPEHGWWVLYLSCSRYKIEVVEDGICFLSVDSEYLCH